MAETLAIHTAINHSGVVSEKNIKENTTAASSSSSKKTLSGFEVGAKIIKENTKDCFRFVKMGSEWAKMATQSDSLPLTSLFKVAKGGEDALSINEFGESIFKMAHSISTFFTDGIANAISDFARSVLDLTWNTFKIFKTLKSYKIFELTSKYFTPLMAVGGISFSITAGDKIYNTGSELLKLQNGNEIKNKDALILYNLYKLAKNIGLFAVGIIVASNAIFGFMMPSLYMLILGTGILISSFSASIVKATYHLQNN